jgi:hypothetical protein
LESSSSGDLAPSRSWLHCLRSASWATMAEQFLGGIKVASLARDSGDAAIQDLEGTY